MRPALSLALVLAAAAAFAVAGTPARAAAEYFSWVDEDGVLHLTNVRGDRRFRPYSGADAEGFGGQPPIVAVFGGGEERTLYPVDVTRFDDVLRRAAEHYNLPFAFVKAIAKVESNFNPRARSTADAKGLMQLIDETARSLKVGDPFDPEQNVFGGVRYLRILANMFDGDLELTAAAYNAGPERVKKSRGIPAIDQTQRYVARVRKMYEYYRRKRR